MITRIVTPQFFKKDLYLSIKSNDDEYDENGRPLQAFLEPIPFLGTNGINYQYLQSESDIATFGERSQDIVKAVILNTDKAYDYFMDDDLVGSVVYLYGASPTKKPKWEVNDVDREIENGQWANFRVDSIQPMQQHVNVFFERNKRTGAM